MKNKAKLERKAVEIQDERFASALSKPIFRPVSKDKHKTILDDRFQSLLTDEKFSVLSKSKVDQYGRKVKKSKDKQDNELENLYKQENDKKEVEEPTPKSTQRSKQPQEKKQSMEDRLDYLSKLARGEIDPSGSDSSDSSDDEDDSSSTSSSSSSDSLSDTGSHEDTGHFNRIKQKKSALSVPEAAEVEYGEEVTDRLAVLNCDWEHMKAADIMYVYVYECIRVCSNTTIKYLNPFPPLSPMPG
ncbi:hypothetical protein EON65_13895 [archaeon]|nr:MAG: hypothetical protein EON65_13895 [archaeon]